MNMQRTLRQCTEKVIEAMNLATMEMVNLKQNMLTPSLVLLGLLEQADSVVMRIFEEADLDARQKKDLILDRVYKAQDLLPKLREGEQVQLTLSPETEALFSSARRLANEYRDKFISTGVLFLALFDERSGDAAKILAEEGLKVEVMRRALLEVRKGRTVEGREDETKEDILSAFTTDLTEMARRPHPYEYELYLDV